MAGAAPACLRAVATGGARCGAPAPARRWYYSAGLGDCLPFVFRGCGGGDNSFASYADCAALCIPFGTCIELALSTRSLFFALFHNIRSYVT